MYVDKFFTVRGSNPYLNYVFSYMKIHVPSMLAIGVDKHAQQTNKQPQWLRKIIISHHGLENKQPQWLRKIIISHHGLEK